MSDSELGTVACGGRIIGTTFASGPGVGCRWLAAQVASTAEASRGKGPRMAAVSTALCPCLPEMALRLTPRVKAPGSKSLSTLGTPRAAAAAAAAGARRRRSRPPSMLALWKLLPAPHKLNYMNHTNITSSPLEPALLPLRNARRGPKNPAAAAAVVMEEEEKEEELEEVEEVEEEEEEEEEGGLI